MKQKQKEDSCTKLWNCLQLANQSVFFIANLLLCKHFISALNKTAELLEAEGMTLDDYTYDNKGIFMQFLDRYNTYLF